VTIAEQEADELSERDLALIAAIASGRTVTEAAAELGISAPTAYRRLGDPAFAARLATAKAANWSPESTELRSEFRRSVAHMVATRDDENVHASTRLRAAQAICDLALRVTKEVELAARVAALEQLAAEGRTQ
jgi:hypothetical protein